MVGADWLRDIAPAAKPPLRIVFSSIKGGVGRSTALCVAAAHLAAQGRRVLAIDMDLEAPGLGNMLLPDGTLPKFGLLDYLVESGLLPVDDDFYVDLVASSWLGGGKGRVDVVPAIGQSSLDNPANVLAKIARAYLDGGVQVGSDHDSEGLPSFMDRMRALIDRLAAPYSYDVVLIDARAGLHETTATAVVGLGAEVVFFGLDQPQTFAGYELLFAHLAEFQSVVDSVCTGESI
jgi:cellulose biosynthesis protein BcsQ